MYCSNSIITLRRLSYEEQKTLYLAVTLTLVLLFLTGPAVAANIDTSLEDLRIEHYEYPINVDSADWFNYSVIEKVNMLIIPDHILARMTNAALVTAIQEYPYVGDIYIYGDSIGEAIEIMRPFFSALDEIISRNISSQSLLNLADSLIDPAAVNGDGYSLESFSSKAALDLLDYLCQPEVPIDPNAIVVQPGTPSTVYTPNGSLVSCTIQGEPHSLNDHDEDDQYWITTYGVTRIRIGSCSYNCHSYAWHSRSSANSVWIDNPSIYMSDGSYSRVYSGSSSTAIITTGVANGDIIYYGGGTHSAVYIGNTASTSAIGTGLCRSKWGPRGLFQHTLGQVPAAYQSNSISIWRR